MTSIQNIMTASKITDPKVIDAVRSVMEAGVDTDVNGEALASYVMRIDLDPNGYDTDDDMIAQGHTPSTEAFNDDVRTALYQALSA